MAEEVDLGIPGIVGAQVIGRGGFGVVYRARQVTSGGGDVAVKVLAGHLDEAARVRFEREAAALGSLRGHPNICTVYFAGTDGGGRPYLVMEYAPTSLAQLVAGSGPMPWKEVATLGVELAGALETAHRANLLHRDVKPENVLRTRFGRWLLADFGLARFNDDTLSRGLTTTVSHAAPELLQHGRASVATDIYALGSTLFVALTGRAAFAGDDDSHPVSIYRRIAEDPVPEMPDVPGPIAAIVRTAMAKDPAGRFSSASEMGEALRAAQRSAGLATTPLLLPSGVASAASEVASGEEPTAGSPTPHAPAEHTRAVERGGRDRRAPAEVDDAGGDGGGPAPRRRPPVAALVGAVALIALLLVGGAVLLAGGDGDGEGARPPSATRGSSTDTVAEEPTLEELRTATLSDTSWEVVTWEATECSGPDPSVSEANCADDGLFDTFALSTSCTSTSRPPADCELIIDDLGISAPMTHDGTGYTAEIIDDFALMGQIVSDCESSDGILHLFRLVPTSAQKRGSEWVATSVGGTVSVFVNTLSPSCGSEIAAEFQMRSD